MMTTQLHGPYCGTCQVPLGQCEHFPGSLPPRPVTLAAGTTARCACPREIGWTECGGARQAGFGFLWAWCPRCLTGFVHADTEAGYRAWVAALAPEWTPT